MNKNIDVINENLWVVNFEHIKMGYIKGLTLNKTDDFMTLSNDGKIFLNKADKDIKKAIQITSAVMTLPDEKLGTKQGFFKYMKNIMPKWEEKEDKWIDLAIKYYNLESLEKAYESVSKWEKKRRSLKAEYIRGQKKPTVIDKIKTLIKRKGVR